MSACITGLFQTRPGMVEALQWRPDMDGASAPPWFGDMLRTGRAWCESGSTGRLWLRQEERGGGPDVNLVAFPGDWVVHNMIVGRVEVWRRADFPRAFMPAPTSGPNGPRNETASGA